MKQPPSMYTSDADEPTWESPSSPSASGAIHATNGDWRTPVAPVDVRGELAGEDDGEAKDTAWRTRGDVGGGWGNGDDVACRDRGDPGAWRITGDDMVRRGERDTPVGVHAAVETHTGCGRGGVQEEGEGEGRRVGCIHRERVSERTHTSDDVVRLSFQHHGVGKVAPLDQQRIQRVDERTVCGKVTVNDTSYVHLLHAQRQLQQ
jgi:hypothetical protein